MNVKRNGSARKRAAIQWVMTHLGCPSLRDAHKKKGHDFHRIPLIFNRKAILRSGPKAYSLLLFHKSHRSQSTLSFHLKAVCTRK